MLHYSKLYVRGDLLYATYLNIYKTTVVVVLNINYMLIDEQKY